MMEAPTETTNAESSFAFTPGEVKKLESALKEEEFVRLLADYARDLADPANKARYEAEIAEMERERGYAVTFLHPQPGYVIKTVVVAASGAGSDQRAQPARKIFLNICSEPAVERPSSCVGREGERTGLRWSLPYSLSQPREDCDRSGGACTVYDVVFHPDALYLAGRDPRFKELVHSTALDAVEAAQAGRERVERAGIKFPRLKFKGVARPTVIRKPLSANSEQRLETEATSQGDTDKSLEPSQNSSQVIIPKYTIRYRTGLDLQDYLIQSQDVVLQAGRPKELVLDIQLPLLSSAVGVDLDVQEKTLSLVRDSPPSHRLSIALPYPVLEERGEAKFDKTKKCLTVTLPVKAAAVIKAERLSSNDSGIEVEEGEPRPRDSLDSHTSEKLGPAPRHQPRHTSQEEAENGDDDDESDKPGRDSDPTTDTCCDKPSAARRRIHSDDDEDGDDEGMVSDGGQQQQQRRRQQQLQQNRCLDYRTRADSDWLEAGVGYALAPFTCVLRDSVIILTLEVKNASPGTVVVRVVPGQLAVCLLFSSLGSGMFPIHYAFCLDFQCGGQLEVSDIEVECWDNNLVVQFGWREGMHSYRVGTSFTHLRERLHSLNKYRQEELGLNDQEGKKENKKKRPKYSHEKHPKLMAAKEEEEDEEEEEEDGGRKEKERHSSGDSLMSLSPYESVMLREERGCRTEADSEMEEEEGSGNKPRFLRAVSVESHQEGRRIRGILKKRHLQIEGTRFRCYSESNVDEYGWNSLTSSLSQTKIAEEEEEEEGGEEGGSSLSGSRKSVTFSEKVHQQIFRINSTILAKTAKNKRKADKKRKALERRVSEGDSNFLDPISSCCPAAKGGMPAKSRSLDVLSSGGQQWGGDGGGTTADDDEDDDESHEDSGLASSYEEGVLVVKKKSGGASAVAGNAAGDGSAAAAAGESGTAAGGAAAGANQPGRVGKAKRKTKRRTKQFEMSSELIFDLDI